MNKLSIKSALSFFLALAATGIVWAADPVARVLTQEKLDRFLGEMDSVMSDEVVAAAWNDAYQATAYEAMMDPESTLGTADPLTAVFMFLDGARVKVKKNAEANAALAGFGWTNEFWDVYVTATIGLHYAAVLDFNEAMAAEGGTEGDALSELPPIGTIMHPDDFALVRANYERIFDMVGEEAASQNGW